MADWIKDKEAEFVTQAQDFSAKITANPVSYGLVAADATALAADVASYVALYEEAADPTTRTRVVLEARDTAQAVLEARMRSLGRRIQANPNVTNAQRTELTLTVRDTTPTPVNPPSTRPVLIVKKIEERTVSVRMSDSATPTKRAKAAGSIGAEVFSFVGAEAPADLSGWQPEGVVTRSDFNVVFTSAPAAGAKVWIIARWFNRRGEEGPLSTPVGAFVGGGVAMAA